MEPWRKYRKEAIDRLHLVTKVAAQRQGQGWTLADIRRTEEWLRYRQEYLAASRLADSRRP